MKSAKDIQDVIFLEGSFYVSEPLKHYYWGDLQELEKSKYLIGHKSSEYLISSEDDLISEFCEMFNIQDIYYCVDEVFEYLNNYEFRDQVIIYKRINLNITF